MGCWMPPRVELDLKALKSGPCADWYWISEPPYCLDGQYLERTIDCIKHNAVEFDQALACAVSLWEDLVPHLLPLLRAAHAAETDIRKRQWRFLLAEHVLPIVRFTVNAMLFFLTKPDDEDLTTESDDEAQGTLFVDRIDLHAVADLVEAVLETVSAMGSWDEQDEEGLGIVMANFRHVKDSLDRVGFQA